MTTQVPSQQSDNNELHIDTFKLYHIKKDDWHRYATPDDKTKEWSQLEIGKGIIRFFKDVLYDNDDKNSNCAFYCRNLPSSQGREQQWLLRFFVDKAYEQRFLVNKNFEEQKPEAKKSNYAYKSRALKPDEHFPIHLSILAVMYPTSPETPETKPDFVNEENSKRLGKIVGRTDLGINNFEVGSRASYCIKSKFIAFFAHRHEQKYQLERFILLKALAFAYLKAIEHFSTALSKEIGQLSLGKDNILVNRKGFTNNPDELSIIEYDDLDQSPKITGLTPNADELEKLYFEAVKFNAGLYFHQPVRPHSAELPIVWKKLDEIFNVDKEQQELIDQMSLIHKVITNNDERHKNNLEKARQQAENARQKAKKEDREKWQKEMQRLFVDFTIIQVFLAIVQTILEKDSDILNWCVIIFIIGCLIIIGLHIRLRIGTLFPKK